MRDLLPIICSGQASKGGRIQLIHGSRPRGVRSRPPDARGGATPPPAGPHPPPTRGEHTIKRVGAPPPRVSPNPNPIWANRSCKGSGCHARQGFEILSRFLAISIGCEAENFPARRIRQLWQSCGSQPERAVSRGGRVPDLVASGFRDHTISGRGFNLFKRLRRHFRATPFCRLGKEFGEGLGTDSEARKKANAPQPLIRLLAALREARPGFDGGRRRFWVAGLL